MEHVTDQYHGGRGDFYEEPEEHRPSIYHAQVVEGTHTQCVTDFEADLLPVLRDSIQPVRYPFSWEIQGGHALGCQDILQEERPPSMQQPPHAEEEKEAAAESPFSPRSLHDQEHPHLENGPRTIILITTRLEFRRDLADTGASISATGIRSILHGFQNLSDYQIKGYDGKVAKAAGQGYAQIYNPDTQQTDEILFVYTPAVTGTIISLDHHARTHRRIHRWTQEATPSDDRGKITLLAADGTVVSFYHTVRAGGLYYIQDLNFIPVLEAGIDDGH